MLHEDACSFLLLKSIYNLVCNSFQEALRSTQIKNNCKCEQSQSLFLSSHQLFGVPPRHITILQAAAQKLESLGKSRSQAHEPNTEG